MNYEQYKMEYSESHQNPVNIKIHTVCVPLILWTIIALLDMAKLPYGTVGHVAIVLTFFYYHFIEVPLFENVLFVYITMTMLLLSRFLGDYRAHVAILVFVLAWIGQFWGHKIEGKKPSFFKDIFFLLIGPMWVLEKMKKKNEQ